MAATPPPREVEARAYVEQYRNADGSPGNYRTDLIADLLDALDEARAESNRQLNQARAKVSELAVKLAEARRRPEAPPTEFQARLTERKEQQFAELLRRLCPWERTHRPVCVTMWSADDRGLVR